MKKLLIAPVLALALSGCATTGGGGSLSSTITQIRDAARALCKFEPTVNTVAELLGAFGVPGVAAVPVISTKICAAVSLNPMTEGPRGGRTVPKVDGVPIRGKFVR